MANTDDVGQDFTDPSFEQAVQNANDKAAAADAAATRANAVADDLQAEALLLVAETADTYTFDVGTGLITGEDAETFTLDI